jgi:hypothetical protein
MVDAAEELQGPAYLVALQVSNHVPRETVPHVGGLGLGGLNPVLADVAHSEVPKHVDHFRAHRFGDRDEGDVLSHAARPVEGSVDSFADIEKVPGKGPFDVGCDFRHG